MPLIEVHAPPQPASVEVTAVCRRLNAAVAAAIPCRLDAVWTTWRTIDGAYVRGDVASADDGSAPFGPIVHVFHHRSTEEIVRAVEAIEAVLSRELSIDRGDVFVTTRPVTIDDPTHPPHTPDAPTAVT
jgi:hypothetical protein